MREAVTATGAQTWAFLFFWELGRCSNPKAVQRFFQIQSPSGYKLLIRRLSDLISERISHRLQQMPSSGHYATQCGGVSGLILEA